ncbi:Protein saf4 [Colletotrichum tropicale]|nr:Protein saf4 [Colletotrichum tropicale]
MQGFNMGRYVPPDVEGSTSGNKLHGKHALGARASKLSSGILTVRFEMPYAIWCSTCPKPTIIGQGVRFNAEKKRVGSYYSTPIWQFRMRHADCGGAIEIKTDPKSTAYVVVSGAKKRDVGEDDTAAGAVPREGAMVIMTDEERQKLRSNAFASLEKTIEDRQQLAQATERIDELEDVSKRQWDDPYSRNKALRQTFRVGRKEREKEAAVGEALKDKMSLGIDLVPATEEDAQRAALVDFAPDDDATRVGKALAKPLFRSAGSSRKAQAEAPKGTPKAELLASKRRHHIVSEIVGNTRMSQDPFLLDARTERTPPRIPGLKRKRDVKAEDPKTIEDGPKLLPSKALVGYDSDSG